MSTTTTTTATDTAPPTTPSIPEEVYKKWNIVYPIYLDSTVSSRKGRLLAKDKAVPNPTGAQLFKACKILNLTDISVPETEKKHPRDQLNPGRLRIKMQDEKGNFTCGGRYADKRDLLVALAKEISEIQQKEKQQKQAKKQLLEQKQKKKASANTSQVRTFQGAGKSKKGKKKGKR